MNILFGTISIISVLTAIYGYSKVNKVSLKKLCLQLPILIILILAATLLMVKWYEVPIHHNRISYFVSSNNTPYEKFEGVTKIDISYNYNTYKGIKEIAYGFPSETNPMLLIETCLKGVSGKGRGTHSYGGYDNIIYFLNDTVRRVSSEERMMEGRELVRNNSDYLSYLKHENIEPFGYDSSLLGTQLIIECRCSNRQSFYALSWCPLFKHMYLRKDSFVVTNLFLPDSIINPDTLKIKHLLEYFIPNNRTRDNTSIIDYSYIPPKDSVIYNIIGFSRSDFKSPDFIFTAEDISSAVELLWIEGLNESNIRLKSLSFDYIGPTEFSEMFPEPDVREVSKITFTDKKKISEILKKGLRFHVKFPDMENVQQIRIFAITLILGGLLGLLIRVLYNIVKKCSFYESIKKRISKKMAIILYVLFAIISFAILVLCAIHSYVDAFNLDGGDSFGIINDIKEL